MILEVDQPYENHNGGWIGFGPDDRFLYLGLGDGGSGYDPGNRGQSLTTLLGKMLRIDVLGTGAGYRIPADNPWAGGARCTRGTTPGVPCPEIWAFGLRNPWRWSFDRTLHELWVGDVGQDRWEEVDRVQRGLNYGWKLREGTHCTDGGTSCPSPGTVLNGATLVDPEVDYPHGSGGGSSITGGFVYRGAAMPAYRGLYFFGDFASNRIWTHQPGVAGNRTEVATASGGISSFAEDAAGELYVVGYGNGQLFRLGLATAPPADTIPTSLLATGCVDPQDPTRPAAGLIPYRLNAPFWSDGALKERWLALPDGGAVTVGADGDWDFPSGTVLMKRFQLGGKLIETRLLMKHPDGVWAGYTYQWNEAQTDATRVQGGATRVIGAQTWLYPSEQQCLQCHTAAAGRSLGLETAQQNGDLTYPATGRTANQLLTLSHVGVAPSLSADPATYPAYPDPLGTAGTLEQRARAYLHANCSQCHRPGGPTPTSMDFRYATPLAGTGICDVAPLNGDLGLTSARIVAPGAPGRSVLLERMKRLDATRMPPLGSAVVDEAGAQAVGSWIQALTGCP
ncbi:MAG: PQQ-dependent sugar dehydrogenase [Anaeromyxobacter sp.]